MPEVLTAGEVLGAVRADGLVRLGGRARLSIAGAEANVAMGLARLGHECAWVGVVGNDQLGALALRTLQAEGVDVSGVRWADAPTGILVSEERLGGIARVDYHRRASAGSLLGPDDLLAALETPPRIVHLTGLTMALGEQPAEAVRVAAAAARERGSTVCLDVNHRQRLWSAGAARRALAPLAPLLDLVIASDDELPLLAPAGEDLAGQVQSLLDCGVREVVVKLGALGATAYTAQGSVQQAARPVAVVDTIGAGDGFVAGYLSGLLDGLDVPARLARAVTVGGFVVSTAGDWEGLPLRSELGMLDLQSGEVVR